MAGTIYSLALSQRFDNQGRLLINAPLYLYEANTLDPVDSYRNSGLTILNPWPIRTDSFGMIPEFWLPDGSYRARMTDEAGAVVYFDLQNVLAIGPSSGGGGGGGGGVDQNAIFSTGEMMWKPVSGVKAGWVRANGRTIGSATSGATERANEDTQPLFEFLYNNFPNNICPVTGGRGANAAVDFAANKAIATLNMRGRGPMGLDDMGNTAEGVITDGTPTVPGSGGGGEKTTIQIARNNLPNVNMAGTTNSYSHRHTNFISANTTVNNPAALQSDESPVSDNSVGGQIRSYRMNGGATNPTVGRSSQDTHSHTTSTNLNGNVTQQNIVRNVMSPYRLGTWFLKL